MFINNRDLAVIVTDWDAANQQIGCFAVSSIIALRHQPGTLNGLPHEDLTKGYDCGSVTCTADQWRRINRWVSRGDFCTIHVTAGGEYRFGFCTRQQLVNRGVTEADFAWLNAYAEAADYEYRRLIEPPAKQPEPPAKQAAQKPVKAKKERCKAKDRRRQERRGEDREWHQIE